MKNNISEKSKPNMSALKNSYYITLENANKRTQGGCGSRQEALFAKRYSG